MRAALVNLNHCAVPILSRAANLSWCDSTAGTSIDSNSYLYVLSICSRSTDKISKNSLKYAII